MLPIVKRFLISSRIDRLACNDDVSEPLMNLTDSIDWKRKKGVVIWDGSSEMKHRFRVISLMNRDVLRIPRHSKAYAYKLNPTSSACHA
jgi:hypothetical protein